MISITVNGVKELLGDLKPLPEKVENRVIERMSQIAYDEVQRGAGRHFQTGALFQSVFNKPVRNGRSVGHDARRAPHAVFVIFGTRPHVIKPRKKKALRWVGPNGFVFAKSVNHPGYRGDDYMQPARDKAIAQFQKLTGEALKANL